MSLCRTHHRWVHEGGGSVAVIDDGFEFRDRDGALIVTAPTRPPAPALQTAGIDPNRARARSDRWAPIDWPYLVDVQVTALGWNRPPR